MPELWVMDNDQYEQAMTLIKENLPTSPSPTTWKCANCGEQLEGQFTSCWRCGALKSL